MLIIVITLLAIPIFFTIWNIITFIQCLYKQKDATSSKIMEVIALIMGISFSLLYISFFDIQFVAWDVPLYAGQLHSMIDPNTFPTIITISIVSLIGYFIIRFVPLAKQSPIISFLGIAALYLGMGLLIVWCIQTSSHLLLSVFPLNCILLFLKAIYLLVYQKSKELEQEKRIANYAWLETLFNKATYFPFVGLVLVLPLLGIILVILILFGQTPDSIIKAWSETADWTFSQKIAPPSLSMDGHYLCTVAAGGHRKVVKPLRTGMRHGHCVIVNRQLCIANAFEQLIEEKTPSLHRIIRKTYDTIGYPISKHILSKQAADITYYLMKPLEWLFLLALYTFDKKPENRIALQYPHAAIPKHES